MNAQTPNPLLAEFITVSTRLTDLMTAEVAALRAMRPKDISPMQEEKAELTERYALFLKTFREDDRPIRLADPETRAQTKNTIERLHKVTADNTRALTAARAVNERLLRHVADVVTQKSNPKTGYAPNGATVQRAATQADAVVPVTLNTEI